jgi:hypothetical protein
MESSVDDRFVVFVRDLGAPHFTLAEAERELVTCSTYEEARWVRRENGTATRKCIIRYVGPAGGGD